MTTIIVWLLIAVSDGGYNHGTTTVVGKFATQQDCFNAEGQMKRLADGIARTQCIEAKIVKE